MITLNLIALLSFLYFVGASNKLQDQLDKQNEENQKKIDEIIALLEKEGN